MTVSHKTRVVAQYLVPIAIGYFAIGSYLFTGALPEARELTRYLGGMAGLIVAGTLAQDIVPKSFKEFLIFWRMKNRLPGHQAFTRKYERPDRFDHAKIINWAELGALPPTDRQRIFYEVYRKHAQETRVEHISFRYLAWRDSASMLFLLSVVTIPALGLYSDITLHAPAVRLALLSLVACLGSIFAARNAADDLVVQVLSNETLEGSHGIPR